jgi:hypothetical protein
MATPLAKKQQETQASPRSVTAAKVVELALISYVDESNQPVTQLALVGENTVQLLESRSLGITKNTTPAGTASEWIKKGVFEALGRK